MVKISKDAQKVLGEYGEGAKEYVLNKGGFGNRLTSGEVRRILADYNAVPIAEASQAISEPQIVPDFSDPVNLRNRVFKDVGVTTLQDEVSALTQKLRDYDTKMQQHQMALDRPESINLIRGRQSEAYKQDMLGRESILNELQTKTDLLSARQAEADRRYQELLRDKDKKEQIMLQFPSAGITYTDNFEDISKKLDKFKKEEERRLRKEAEKQAIKDMFIKTFGYLPRKKSTKWLRRKLKKEGISTREYAKRMQTLELEKLRTSIERTRGLMGGGGSDIGGYSLNIDKTDKGIATIIDEAINSGDDWGTIASVLAGAGIDVNSGSLADRYLRYKFLGEDNPLESF